MKNKWINCNGKPISFEKPRIMGILNVNPDSFFDGGKYLNEQAWLSKTEQMLSDGADFIDVGCSSSRPGASLADKAAERKLLQEVLSSILKYFPETLISVDTYYAESAQCAVETGACMINDISAGSIDPLMFETVARLKVPYILMHIQGRPENMQQAPSYKNVAKDVVLYLSQKISILKKWGQHDIIIDPGFGFGKTIEQNYELLQHLEVFNLFDQPLLVGISRKSMIYKLLKTTPEEALNGTTVLNTLALMKGANMLRVHDVKEAKECIALIDSLKKID
jgi:dihydropteroate synthase